MHCSPKKIRSSHCARLAAALVVALVGSAATVSANKRQPHPQAKYLLQWGRHGSAPGEFDFPVGVALGREGQVFVSDFYNARVQSFTPEGKYVASFPVLPNPGGLAVDHVGNLYLSHFSAMRKEEEKKPDRISVYSPKGNLLRQWGQTGTGDGEFDYPGGVAVSKDGRVYVADQTNRRVQVFDQTGRFLFKWGVYGTGDGQFGGNVTPRSRVGGPQFVTLDSAGNVYTTEASVGRVQEFTSAGQFLRKWGNNEDRSGGFGGGWLGAPGGMSGPIGICVDSRNRVWVSAVSGRVQQFSDEGELLQVLEETPGPLRAPHGVATDNRDNLFVVDSFNHRVLKYWVGR